MKITFILQVLLLVMLHNLGIAQNKIPLQIENKTTYTDDEIYIAIVGKSQEIRGQFIYLDIETGIQKPMDRSLNTLPGPVGDDYSQGPDGKNRYADIFVKLSEISNKTISIEAIESSRIFLSFNNPLFLFFHCPGPGNCIDENGNTVGPGYTSPDPNNPFDPNRDFLYEIVELNLEQNNTDLVFHGNTSRVDSFQYPIGLEITGSRGTQTVGEISEKNNIVTAFTSGAPIEFKKCVDEKTGVITAPSKTPEFKEGQGIYANYFQPYIDRVWEKYKTSPLAFRDGDGVLWEGGVEGERLIVTGNAPGSAFDGQQAIIEKRPNTQEVLEGKGVFNSGNAFDKRIQAQFCAAFNRHVINDQAGGDPGIQDWGNPSTFYQTSPYNYYASFWHNEEYVLNGKGYGFAYDDVFDQASLLYEPKTEAIKIVLGSIQNNTSPPPSYTSIPGVLEAENYKPGGSGIGYQDFTSGNTGGAYKQDDVDIENTVDTKGEFNVGWIDTGEWLAYDINATSTLNTYDIDFRVASPNGQGKFHLEIGGVTITDVISVPNTGNWQKYETVTVTDINIPAGQHELRVVFDNSGLNLNYIAFKVSPIATESCSGTAENQQYRYEVSSDLVNPDIIFIPKNEGIGDTVCILYYGTSPTGPYPGYSVKPNEPYQINASEGEQIYFYYTYSLPTGGENNTANQKHNLIVGTCSPKSGVGFNSEAIVFPNPIINKVQIQLSPKHSFNRLEVVDILGKVIHKQDINSKIIDINFDMSQEEDGLYLLNLYGKSGIKNYKLLKK